MSARVFVDTNILVYAVDKRDAKKHRKARDLLDSFSQSTPVVCSTQVLQEMYVALTRKLGIAPAEVRALVALARRQSSVQPITPDRVLEAIDCSILNQISLWDALVVVCAAASGCDTLWSEDLGDGQIINGVKIVNPLR